MSAIGYGELTVFPLSAKLKRDTEVLGKMDPYCKFICGPNKQCSGIQKNGGKFPQWKDKLLFHLKDEKTIDLEVWDSDTMSKDDLIGATTIFLDDALKQGDSQKWYTLNYKGKDAGSVLVKFLFEKTSATPPPIMYNPTNPNTIPMRMSMGNNNQGPPPNYAINQPGYNANPGMPRNPTMPYSPGNQNYQSPGINQGYYPAPNQQPQNSQGYYPPPQNQGYYPPPQNQQYPPQNQQYPLQNSSNQGYYPPPQNYNPNNSQPNFQCKILNNLDPPNPQQYAQNYPNGNNYP